MKKYEGMFIINGLGGEGMGAANRWVPICPGGLPAVGGVVILAEIVFVDEELHFCY